jgi:predicted amidohydrolase
MRLLLLQPTLRAFDTEHCIRSIEALFDSVKNECRETDVALLPEHAVFTGESVIYESFVRSLAREYGCCIVGGSHHENGPGRAVNTGLAMAPDGSVLGRYEKLRPYSDERKQVSPGSLPGEFAYMGARILVLICADFWFSDLFFRARDLPDVVLVPALSVTRKEKPDYSRALWRHLAVTRSYEFGMYAGISDWAHESELPKLFACGVSGFADPTRTEPERFFSPVGESGVEFFPIELDRLEEFRKDRRERGFFWK